MRVKTKTNPDKRYFTRTAAHTKSINLGQKIFRGGIRF